MKHKFKVIHRFIASTVGFMLPLKMGKNLNGFDVSVTSHGRRILAAGIAITSFCLGSKSIRNIYFTIDEEEQLSRWKVFFLQWLKIKGVMIIYGPRRGPHSKYWYYLHKYWDGNRPFMLIDDDVIYERDTADVLFKEAQRASGNVCVRSLICKSDGDCLLPYKTWLLCSKKQSNYEVFATNVGGVVISPKFARKLIELGDSYRNHCSTVDDVWFHWISVHYDMPYTQAENKFRNPTPIPFTQEKGLSNTINITANDESIRNQYSALDIKKLFSKINSHSHSHSGVST